MLCLSALLLAGCGAADDGDSDDAAETSQSQSQETSDDASTGASGEATEQSSDGASDGASDDATSDSMDDASDDVSEAASDGASGAGDDASAGVTEGSSGSGGGLAAGSGVPADSAQLGEILGAAEDTLEGSTAISIEEKGSAGWKVTVVEGSAEQEVRVSEDLSTGVDETEQDDQEVDPALVDVSMAEAIEAASADQDGTVTEASLDDEDGAAVRQVEFDDEIEVEVDADSGDVVSVDR